MGDLDRDVQFSIDLDTSDVEKGVQLYQAGVQRMASASVQAGQQSAAAATPQLQALANLNDRLLAIGKRYQETGQISTRALSATGAQLKSIEEEYGKAASAADKLSVAERTALTAQQGAYRDAIGRLREYNSAQQEVTRQTHNWTDLQGALEGVGGTVGKLTTAVVGVVGAFEAGYAMGQKLNELLESLSPEFKKTRDEFVTTLGEIAAGVKQYQSLSDLRAPQGPKGEQTFFQANLGEAFKAQGLSSIDDATAKVKKLQDQLSLLKIDDNFQASLGRVGTGVESFLQQNRAFIEGLGQTLNLSGKQIPTFLQGVIDKLQQFDAAVTKSQTNVENLKAIQTLANQAADLQKSFGNLELKFRAPTIGPVEQAIREVHDLVTASYQDLNTQERARSQDIEAQAAAYRELGAEIAKQRATGNVGPEQDAEIAKLQQKQAIILKTIQSDKDAVTQIEAEKQKVTDLGAALEKVRVDAALAKMAQEAAAALAKVRAQIDDIGASAQDSLGGMFGGDQFSARVAGIQAQAQNEVTLSFGFPKEFQAGIQASAVSWAKTTTDASLAAAKNFSDVMGKAEEDFQQKAHEIGSAIGDVFVDLMETGGQNFGHIASQFFLKGVQDGASQLTELFGKVVVSAFGGQEINPNDPKYQGAGGDKQLAFDEDKAAHQQQAIMAGFQSAIGVVGQTLQELQNAKKGQQTSVLGSTLSFAAYGASIGTAIAPGLGTIIGALAGALVGGILASVANAKAKKELPYAGFGVQGGEAYLQAYPGAEKNFQNITQKQYNDMINQVNTSLDAAQTSYIKLLLKFPAKVIDGLASFAASADNFKFTPTMGTNTLKTFQDDFDNWVNNTLPKHVADEFEANVSKAFEAMGMTSDRFSALWTKLQGMDPKDAEQILNDTADALVAFGHVNDILKNTANFNPAAGALDANGRARAAGVSDFQQSLLDAGSQLKTEALEIANLPFAQQAAAAKELGASLSQLGDSLVQFLNTVVDTQKQLSASIDQARFQLALQNTTDPQGKSDLLSNRLFAEYAKIQNAATLGLSPQEVQNLVTDATGIINQLYNLDPSKRYQWADSQLANLDKYQTDALKALGDQARKQFQDVVDAMQPAVEFFEGLPTSLGDPMADLAAAATSAAAALNNLATAGGGGAGAGSTATNSNANGNIPRGSTLPGTRVTNDNAGAGTGGRNVDDYSNIGVWHVPPRGGHGRATDDPGGEGNYFMKPWDYGPDDGGWVGNNNPILDKLPGFGGGSKLPSRSGAGWGVGLLGQQETVSTDVPVALDKTTDLMIAAWKSGNADVVKGLSDVKLVLDALKQIAGQHLTVAQDGRDVRVSLAVTSDTGDTEVFDDIGGDGFTDRALNARGRR